MTYVPLVPLLEALGGGDASWDPESRTARADTGIFQLTVPVGESWLLADGSGSSVGMTAAPVTETGICTSWPKALTVSVVVPADLAVNFPFSTDTT